MKKQLLFGFIALATLGLTSCSSTGAASAITPPANTAPGINCESLKTIIENPPATETEHAIEVYKQWYKELKCQ